MLLYGWTAPHTDENQWGFLLFSRHHLNTWIKYLDWECRMEIRFHFFKTELRVLCVFFSLVISYASYATAHQTDDWMKGEKMILWQLLVCSFLIKMAYVPNVIGCSISSSFPNWMTRKKVHLKSTLTSAHQFAYPIPWNGLIYYLSYEYLVNSSNRPHATLPAHHISYVSFMSCGILSPWFY